MRSYLTGLRSTGDFSKNKPRTTTLWGGGGGGGWDDDSRSPAHAMQGEEMTETKQGLSAPNTTIPQAASTYFPSHVMKLDLNVAYTQRRLPGPMHTGCVRRL